MGDSYTLTCRIDYPDGFEGVPTISWVRTEDGFSNDV